MRLTTHRCVNFRNIERLELFSPGRGVTVICGANGHGKTNLLESIFLLTGARSFRGSRDAPLIMRNREAAAIESEFFCEDRLQQIKLTISEKGRIASLNQGSDVKAAALAGKFCCVVFSPEHLNLVKGSPEVRRRFLDTALCQISPAFLANIKRYNRLLAQRNSLLKDAGAVGAALDLLDVYDAQFLEAAIQVTQQRRRFVDELLPLAAGTYAAISEDREHLNFRYISSLFPEGGADYDEGLRRMAGMRAEEVRAGCCLLGPHRDELAIALDGADARVYASQGQQRCIVLAFKLAEAEIMELRLSERPVLLLDDVLSELDGARQDFLISSITDTQAIITSCAPELILNRAEAEVFVMREGRLEGSD